MIKIDKSVDHHVLPACLLVNSCKLLAKTGRLTHAVVPVLHSLGSTACSQAAVECKGTGQYGQCVGDAQNETPGWLVGWLVGDKVFFKDVCTFFGWWPLLGF